MSGNAAVISVRDLVVDFGGAPVLDHVTLDVFRGEILGFVGGSGAGKSVLMRTIIGLLPKRNGSIEVFGADLAALGERERRSIERRWGVLFQQGALFSSLTALQNVQFPIREYLDLSPRLIEEIAVAKLEMVGLGADVRGKFPAELSGGMVKRVALARALALDPDIVFLDEPTSGLDPIGAAEFDELIRTLQRTLGLSVFMVTHDLDSLHAVCDRIAVLSQGRVIAAGTIETMLASEHPWLKSYFQGKTRAPRLTDAAPERPYYGDQGQLHRDRRVHARRHLRRVRLHLLVPEHRRRRRARGLSRGVFRLGYGTAHRRLGPVQRHSGRRGVRAFARCARSAQGRGDGLARSRSAGARRHQSSARVPGPDRPRRGRPHRRIGGRGGPRRRQRPAADHLRRAGRRRRRDAGGARRALPHQRPRRRE